MVTPGALPARPARSTANHSAESNDEPLAQLSEIHKIYTLPGGEVRVHALRGVSLTFHPAEYVAICGQSGSGKSTLMNLLGCLDRPTAGTYVLGGENIEMMTDDALSEIRGKRLGFVFQNFNLIPQLTVLENLEVPLFYQGVPPHERRARAEHYLSRVGLGDRMLHRPMELSGGQQQRAAIARSLTNDPLILLADEPTGNLDSATGQIILNVFDELNAEGKTILMVTHEKEVAARCKRVITLKDGRILSDDLNGHG